MKKLEFDAKNELCGRYCTDIGGEIPAGAVEVSDELFLQTINEIDGIWRINRETGEVYKEPFPEPEPHVPEQVSRAQGKAALIQAGMWGGVEAYVDSITDPTEQQLALVALNDTTHWQRSSPFLNTAAASLGLTQEQLDDLFRQAAEIEL